MTQLSTLIQGSGKNAIDKRSYIATSGQTAFAVIYSPPYVDVYQNGVRLNVVDYTATSGTSITLTVGAAVNDEIEVIGFISDASIVVNYNTGIIPPAVPIEGMLWYDTTDGSLYIRTGGFWVEASQAGATQGIQGIQGIAGSGVLISGITVTDASYNNTDDTAVGLSGGYIKVTGTGFVSGCTIVVGNVIATSVTFISSTEVRAQLPALAAGTYIMYVSNPSGAVAIRVNAITFSALPTWVSTSPLPNGKLNTAISIQLSGTSDSSVTYALQAGSTLPSGVTLSSSGLLSGTVTGIVADTTYNFTVVATDVELQDSPKAFSITITVLYTVARSLRLRSAASASLSRTPAASGSLTTWTMSMWVKRGKLGVAQELFGALTGSGATTEVYINASDVLIFGFNSSNALVTTAVLRDPAAWYHLVFVWDTNNATAANRVSIYINGVLQVVTLTGSITSGLSSYWNQALSNTIGVFNGSGYFDGEMTEINFIDGQALTAASFGQVSVTSGAWVPNAYSGTYGTNGFFLKFADNSANTAAAIGKDSSGNNNNWTPNNISLTAGSTYDSLLDSPVPSSTTVGNYCVLNSALNQAQYTFGNAYAASGGTIKNANLTVIGQVSAWNGWGGTIGVSTGKWYFEAVQTTDGGYPNYHSISFTNSSGSGYGPSSTSYSVGDIIGFALDLDSNPQTFKWYRNNVLQTTTNVIIAGPFTPSVQIANYNQVDFNFGQRPFTYTPPAGYLALNTFNLPISAVPNPATAMAATTYTGTGVARSISNAVNTVSMQPDLVWVKARVAGSNNLIDSVRGIYKSMFSDATTAEQTYTTGLTAFNSNGFSLGTSSDSNVNINANTYVAWQWKAGGAVSANNNTAGTITSTVSANQAAGFSVVTYTGTGANATVGHGLGDAPRMVIVKSRSARNWIVYHSNLTSAAYYVSLNQTIAESLATNIFNSTAPTNAVFSVAMDASVNASAETYVAYCWAPVAGYSAFGKYTGNGSADGPFVYTGFRPRFILYKGYSAAGYDWVMYDTSRNPTNASALQLYSNTAQADYTGGPIDILSNGFKIRSVAAADNSSGVSYIYAAFAESAFNFATAR